MKEVWCLSCRETFVQCALVGEVSMIDLTRLQSFYKIVDLTPALGFEKLPVGAVSMTDLAHLACYKILDSSRALGLVLGDSPTDEVSMMVFPHLLTFYKSNRVNSNSRVRLILQKKYFLFKKVIT